MWSSCIAFATTHGLDNAFLHRIDGACKLRRRFSLEFGIADGPPGTASPSVARLRPSLSPRRFHRRVTA
jgi:hypothetical protein